MGLGGLIFGLVRLVPVPSRPLMLIIAHFSIFVSWPWLFHFAIQQQRSTDCLESNQYSLCRLPGRNRCQSLVLENANRNNWTMVICRARSPIF